MVLMKQTMITLTTKGSGKILIYGFAGQGEHFSLPKSKHNPKRKNFKTNA